MNSDHPPRRQACTGETSLPTNEQDVALLAEATLAAIPPEYHDELLRQARDMAAAFDQSLETTLRDISMAIEGWEPLKTIGVSVKRRWYERPYWLWQRAIQHRVLREIEADEP